MLARGALSHVHAAPFRQLYGRWPMIAQVLQRFDLISLLTNLAFAVVLYVVLKVGISSFFRRLAISQHADDIEKRARLATLQGIVVTFLKALLVLMFAFAVLESFGIDIKGLLLSASVIGVGISLGSQQLFRDLISGLFILGEGQLNAGDVIEHDGAEWIVILTALRYAVLINCEGAKLYLPYGQITTVKNLTTRAAVDSTALADEGWLAAGALVSTAEAEARALGCIARGYRTPSPNALAIFVTGPKAQDAIAAIGRAAADAGVSFRSFSERDDACIVCLVWDAETTSVETERDA
jgi:hypothetical protein